MPERKENAIRLLEQFAKAGVEPQIVNGYNKSNIEKKEFDIYSALFEKRYHHPPLYGQLACVRAHANAMQIALAQGCTEFLIAEDDITLMPNFYSSSNSIQSIVDELKKNNVVHFGGMENCFSKNLNIFKEAAYVSGKNLRFVHMMCLYGVNNVFASRYLNLMERNGINNDDWYGIHQIGCFDKIHMRPSVIHNLFDSIIDPSGTRLRSTYGLCLKKIVFNLANSHLQSYMDLRKKAIGKMN